MADNTRKRTVRTETHEIKTDGSVVTISDLQGVELAHFSQAECVIEGRVIRQSPLTETWQQFRTSMLDFYQIDVPVTFLPLWLMKKQFATTAF